MNNRITILVIFTLFLLPGTLWAHNTDLILIPIISAQLLSLIFASILKKIYIKKLFITDGRLRNIKVVTMSLIELALIISFFYMHYLNHSQVLKTIAILSVIAFIFLSNLLLVFWSGARPDKDKLYYVKLIGLSVIQPLVFFICAVAMFFIGIFAGWISLG